MTFNQHQALEQIFATMTEGLFLLEVTADSRFQLVASNAAAQRLGIAAQQAQSFDRAAAGLTDAIETGGRECSTTGTVVERRFERRDVSGVSTYAVTFSPVRDMSGRVYRVAGVIRDITVAQQSDAQLRSLQERFSLAKRAAKLGVTSFDVAAGVVVVDDRVRELYGLPPDVIVTAQMFNDAILPDDLPGVLAKWETALAGREDFFAEFRIRRADGEVRWLEGRAVAQYSGDETVNVIAVHWDITARKRAEQERMQLEAQLRQAQKLEAIGTLAGGIAHDFNNILGAILGNVALLAQDVGQHDETQASIAEIRKAAQRAIELVQRLLVFGRRQEQRYRRLHLQPVAEEVMKLLRPTLPAAIELKLSVDDNGLLVLMDPAQIAQVLMNLCVNAYQAMVDQKGCIEIKIAAREIQEGALGLSGGQYVALSVRDDGKGMMTETLEHIFEPFYTTKPIGEGTGLGLAVVHGIVRTHGGAVTVDSVLGRGTVFDIYLPALASGTPCDTTETLTPAVTPYGEGQCILYLDDEEALVFLARRLFARAGYRVEGFTDSNAALESFRAEPTKYDLVITDLSMPGMSGMEVAQRLLAVRPATPVVLVSGYVRQADIEAARALGVRDVVTKPNTVDELVAVVQGLLAGTRSS